MKVIMSLFLVLSVAISCAKKEELIGGAGGSGGNNNNKGEIADLDCERYMFVIDMDDANMETATEFFKIVGNVNSGFGENQLTALGTSGGEIMVTASGNPPMKEQQKISLKKLSELDDVTAQCDGLNFPN